ncbi:hypothetical protein IGB42_01695 [Andreprevotia sp. IGB-42]|uniref:DUF1501 domain-containing protein n=1 Tax=Andreprevotia sp. IGB-42 TaxID=2497473 RepID=UPI001358B009|nr:DUF1501 domain-containing protein [Andreprevotia sp. IGB-42]KAF0814015.1 hypothetical protein IGB42_01695 [Andreprevotia sp. IGB-42]
MSKSHAVDASRREFLKRASALSLASAATPWALSLASLGEAAAAGATDYKALVCVFLYGGNDYANTLIPYDLVNYNLYNAQRPTLAYGRGALDATLLKPAVALADARQYALAPAMTQMADLFNTGRMAAVLNVGTLVQPTTKLQYQKKTVLLPPKLFSHNDQQSVWQSSAAEGANSGWGGRMGDLLMSSNGNATFTCINVSGNAVYLSGNNAVQYQMTVNGPVALRAGSAPLFGSSACSAALQSLITQPRTHLLEAEYNRVTKRALDAGSQLASGLAPATSITTPFPGANSLGDQLKMVARMIASAGTLGTRRQVFFVSMGGFDTHDGLLTVHPGLMGNLSAALAAFHQATVDMGVANQVTTFTASDFGRTLTGNKDGSDHGWGSMHFVLGGAVKGQRFYGTAPVVANNGPDDVGQGRLLPTTSVDQYAATLGSWFGIPDSDLLTVLPNLRNFNASSWNLGFV